MTANTLRKLGVLGAWLASLLGLLLWLASAVTGSVSGVAPAVAETLSGAAPTAGAFTGEFERGLPIYRLPTVTVVASRRVEPAPQHDALLAKRPPARQQATKAAAQPCRPSEPRFDCGARSGG